MGILPNQHVTLDFQLTDEDGEELESGSVEEGDPLVYVHGYGMLVPGLERALAGRSVGEEFVVTLPPEDAYGGRDEELVYVLERSEFPDDIHEGDDFVLEDDEGQDAVVEIVEIRADEVVVDGNHPLSGETLRYQVKVRKVREATESEIEEAAAAFDELRDEMAPGPEDAPLLQIGKKKLLN